MEQIAFAYLFRVQQRIWKKNSLIFMHAANGLCDLWTKTCDRIQ